MAAVDGSWAISTKTPMGDRSGSLLVKSAGASFTGTFSVGPEASEVKGGKVAGDTITCTVDVTSPMPMTLDIEATVSGDSLTGTVKIPGLGTCPLTGVRA